MKKSSPNNIIIGSGIAGLVLAGLLAKSGESVLVLEKNNHLGGRANYFEKNGYFFDMGPSWFMQLDVWNQVFSVLGKDLEQELNLTKLSPGYRVFDEGSDRDFFDVHSGEVDKVVELFDSFEPGAGDRLRKYLEQARAKYRLGYNSFMYRNYDGLGDFFNLELVQQGKDIGSLWDLVRNMHSYIISKFKSPELVKVLEYILIFIGSDPKATPSLYSLMNLIDFEGGVYYPQGGIYELVKALERIASSYGAEFKTNSEVNEIIIENNLATGVKMKNGEEINADRVISNADIVWTDRELMPNEYQQYSDSYWEKRTYAPSAFLLYLGVDGNLPELVHHNFRFAKEWEKAYREVFDSPVWPENPSFYVCVTSKTDDTVAPKGKENVYILAPIAPGLAVNDETIKRMKGKIYRAIEDEMRIPDFTSRIEYERLFTIPDFKSYYHAPKGTGLGLAHTLMQSTVFRPSNVHKQVPNLYFCGSGTNPGIGISIAAISAQNAFKRIAGIDHPRPLKAEEIKLGKAKQ